MRILRAIRERWLSIAGGALMLSGAVAASATPVTGALRHWEHERTINAPSYKARYGHWSLLDVPAGMRVNAVHAAMLYTGKVLIIAGSGNNQGNFDAGKFQSILYDPANDSFTKIATPADMFCGGHAYLPDGRLLIAGGTRRYERLKGTFQQAAGVVTLRNGDLAAPLVVHKGTTIVASDGRQYRAQTDATVPAATPAGSGAAEVWVEALRPGTSGVIKGRTALTVMGLDRRHAETTSAETTDINLNTQDYWGSKQSYIFDPATERYERVPEMTLARWYPTLVSLEGGKVLAVSGLDGFGKMIQGHVEEFDVATRRWSPVPELQKTFPTYPALFLTPGGNLFYSGANAGYGLSTVGRTPGIWDLSTNAFHEIGGLRDPQDNETAGSVLLPPAQDQRYAIVGGGTPPGKATSATSRIDVVDLGDPAPQFKPAGDLPHPTRYPNLVVTPDDKVVITGGSQEYRGDRDSDILECHLYDPKTGKLTRLANPTIGRDYHAEALLLPDGRIITLGSNPVNGIPGDHTPNYFEQRIEVYSPPYLYRPGRPSLTGGPDVVDRGAVARFETPDPDAIATARLIRPSAVTHVTNVEQRSIALTVQRRDGAVDLGVPESEGLVPSGWYMVFVVDAHGTPSVARWVRVR